MALKHRTRRASADRYSVLVPIAALLGVTVAELTGGRPPAVVRDDEHECIRAVRLALSGFEFISMEPTAHSATDHDELRERARTACDLTHEARYRELGRMLPELVPDCERSAWIGRHAGGFRLMAELYHAVAATMAELGDVNAAWVAADRAAVAAALLVTSCWRLRAASVSATRSSALGGSSRLREPSRSRLKRCCRRPGLATPTARDPPS